MGGEVLATGAPVALTTVVFAAGATVSLVASAVLVTCLERVGGMLGLSEAMLGMTAALAANAPEITSATTALARGEHTIGVGVVLGSNVFNLAALLGLSALIAGRIPLHRRVILLAGTIAMWLAVVSVATVAGVPPVAGLLLALVVFVPYVVLSAISLVTMARLPLPWRVIRWIHRAIVEEESELLEAINPEPGDRRDVLLAAAALVVVIVASIAMERSASSLGAHFGLSQIVVGGVVLAAVTSLPNAVAAVYLGMRGRGSAVLSEAMNSNNLNVVLGLLVPGAILGLGHVGSPEYVAAAWYAGLTLVALLMAFAGSGLRRSSGTVIVVGYAAFVLAVVIR